MPFDTTEVREASESRISEATTEYREASRNDVSTPVGSNPVKGGFAEENSTDSRSAGISMGSDRIDSFSKEMNSVEKHLAENSLAGNNPVVPNPVGSVSAENISANSAISGDAPLTERPVSMVSASEMLQREIITGEQMSFMDTQKAPEYRIVGQVFDTYWIIQLDHEMLLMDQHAAHEKINYERFLAQINSGEVFTQQMTPPAVISLTIREEETLAENMEYFTKLGFEIRSLGGREYGVFGVPTVLFDIAPEDYLTQTLDRLTEGGRQEPLLRVLERLASMSCKAAIKGGQKISYTEADHLVAELLKLDNPYQCPHGRPTMISMSEYELEKKFKRIV